MHKSLYYVYHEHYRYNNQKLIQEFNLGSLEESQETLAWDKPFLSDMLQQIKPICMQRILANYGNEHENLVSKSKELIKDQFSILKR